MQHVEQHGVPPEADWHDSSCAYFLQPSVLIPHTCERQHKEAGDRHPGSMLPAYHRSSKVQQGTTASATAATTDQNNSTSQSARALDGTGRGSTSRPRRCAEALEHDLRARAQLVKLARTRVSLERREPPLEACAVRGHLGVGVTGGGEGGGAAEQDDTRRGPARGTLRACA